MYIVPPGILSTQRGLYQRLQQRNGNNLMNWIWTVQLFQCAGKTRLHTHLEHPLATAAEGREQAAPLQFNPGFKNNVTCHCCWIVPITWRFIQKQSKAWVLTLEQNKAVNRTGRRGDGRWHGQGWCAPCLFSTLRGKVKCDKMFNVIRINKGTGMKGRIGKKLSI